MQNSIWTALFLAVALAAATGAAIWGTNAFLSSSVDQATNEYADACVVVVTHPELCISLNRVETPSNGCTNCRYWFRVWNQTAAVGTKAYKTQVLVIPANVPVTLEGKAIQRLRMQSSVRELTPVSYEVIHDEDYFVLDNLCPACLFPEDRLVKLVVEYYECDGVRRFEVDCDLGSMSVKVVRSTFESTGPCKACD